MKRVGVFNQEKALVGSTNLKWSQKILSPSRPRCLRLNVILVVVCLVGDLDGVPLGDDADVALDVALAAAGSVVRVRQHRPLVVELVVCNNKEQLTSVRADLSFTTNSLHL